MILIIICFFVFIGKNFPNGLHVDPGQVVGWLPSSRHRRTTLLGLRLLFDAPLLGLAFALLSPVQFLGRLSEGVRLIFFLGFFFNFYEKFSFFPLKSQKFNKIFI